MFFLRCDTKITTKQLASSEHARLGEHRQADDPTKAAAESQVLTGPDKVAN